MMHDHWSGTVGERPVTIRFDRDQSVVVRTVLDMDEEAGGLVPSRQKGEPIELQPDVDESWEQILTSAGFTAEQASEIIRHLPRVLDAE